MPIRMKTTHCERVQFYMTEYFSQYSHKYGTLLGSFISFKLQVELLWRVFIIGSSMSVFYRLTFWNFHVSCSNNCLFINCLLTHHDMVGLTFCNLVYINLKISLHHWLKMGDNSEFFSMVMMLELGCFLPPQVVSHHVYQVIMVVI